MEHEALLAHTQNQLEREQTPNAPCKICQSNSLRFDTLDFERTVGRPFDRGVSGLPIIYRKCSQCGFIFTRYFDDFTPAQWQARIYNADYAHIDPEFAHVRPVNNAQVIRTFFSDMKTATVGLDYGGGNGTTAAKMRDAGWAYDCWDPFGVNEMRPERLGHYNLCTTFEVFEHLPDPVASLRTMVEAMTTGPLIIMIGTVLSDTFVHNDQRLTNWPYAGPRNGHISLYSRKSLETLAKMFQLDLSGVSQKTHILSRCHNVSALDRRLQWRRILLSAKRRLL